MPSSLQIGGREVELVRSDRKSISIQIKPDGRIVVRAPLQMREKDISVFVSSKQDWIEKHLGQMKEEQEAASDIPRLSEAELKVLAKQAAKVIPERVAYYAPLVGVTYGRITIRTQKTRWGSCSAQGNLNFNCLLMLAPPEVLDSVVVHELCHRKEMNHSKRFYAEVYRVFPEYDKWHGWLKTNGNGLLSKVF